MKFIILEDVFKFPMVKQKIFTTLQKNLHDYLQNEYFDEIPVTQQTKKNIDSEDIEEESSDDMELSIDPKENKIKETKIKVKIKEEMYLDRYNAALTYFQYFEKINFTKMFRPVVEEILLKYDKDYTLDFEIKCNLTKEKGKEKAHPYETVINFNHVYDITINGKNFTLPETANNTILKLIKFKPSGVKATDRTKVFEWIPILIAMKKILPKDPKNKYGVYILNKSEDLSEFFLSNKEITTMLKELTITLTNPDDKKQLIDQGLAIQNFFNEVLIKRDYVITSDKKELGNEVKKTGTTLIEIGLDKKLVGDKFSTFDILFVKKSGTKRHSDYLNGIRDNKTAAQRQLKTFINEFSTDTKSYKESSPPNGPAYMGISMKKSEISQSGKATTFFNEFLPKDYTKKNITDPIEKFKNIKNEEVRKIEYERLRKSLIKRTGLSYEGLEVTKMDFNDPKNDNWFDESRAKIELKKSLQELSKVDNKPNRHKVRTFTFLSKGKGRDEKIRNVQNRKYSAMSYVHSLFSTDPKTPTESNFITMINVALATLGGYNPSYFKVMGTEIVLFNVKKMNMSINTKLPIKITFAQKPTSEIIYVAVPVKLVIFDKNNPKGTTKVSYPIIQFRFGGSGMNPEVGKLKLELSENKYYYPSPIIQEFLDKLDGYK